MKIMIIGAHPSGNKGAEAMLEVLVDNINQNVEGVSFLLETLNRGEDFSAIKAKNLRFSVTTFKPKNIFSPYNVSLSDVGLVIDIGGLSYTDKTFKGNIRNFVKHINLLVRGKKLVFFIQDFGPAKNITTKVLGRIVGSRAAAFFSRSEFTKNVLIESFRVSSEKIFGPYPDCTLLYNNDDTEYALKDSDYIIISPSAIMYNKFGQRYINDLIKIKKYFLNYSNVYVLVNCFTHNDGVSDVDVARMIESNPSNILQDNISPIYLKKILEGASFVVASRYHVLVGAVSSNTPAVSVGWNQKYRSFLELYDIEDFAIVYDSLCYEKVTQTYIDVCNDIEFSKRLRPKNEKLATQVQAAFEELIKTVG